MADQMQGITRLRIFEITRPGLIALTLAVGALWGCLASERITTTRASNDLQISLRKIALLKDTSGTLGKPAARARSSFLL